MMPETTHHVVRADRVPQKIKVAGGAALSAVGLVLVTQQLLLALLVCVVLVAAALAVVHMERGHTNPRSIGATTTHDPLANLSDEDWRNLDIDSVNIDWEQLTTDAPEEDEDVSDFHDIYGEHDMIGLATPPRYGHRSEASAQGKCDEGPEARVNLAE